MRGANSLLVLGAAFATLAAPPLPAEPGAPAGTLTVADAWVRAIPGAAVAAAYMRLHNRGTQPVRVIGVRSALAGHAMIHETRLENGVSTMRPHGPLEIAPGASVTLEPGGLHVMLHDLAHPLAVEEQVSLELLLEGGGRVAVSARVRPLSGQ
jgi:periplasmic copper chaperone A